MAGDKMKRGILTKLLVVFFIAGNLCSEGVDHSIIGIYAVRSSTGKVLIEKNSDLSFVPASCIKIVTTAAALNILGPEFRFETHIEYDGWIDEENILHGNLYIRGGGDPCLGSNRIAGVASFDEQIEIWTQSIKELGIVKIEGKVFGDATQWEKALAVPSWAWEDLGNYYGAGASALSFHENSYALFFKPGEEVGQKATILRTSFPLPSLSFQNEVKTGPEGSGDRACIYGSEFSSEQTVRGTIPVGCKEFSIKGAIPNPSAVCSALLEQSLTNCGITIESQEKPWSDKRINIYTTRSPTVKEIVYETNQKSVNLYAEHLLKKMGEVKYNEGSTEAGIRAVKDFWISQGLDSNGFNVADGSGLSRQNLITPKQLVSMLLKVEKMNISSCFFESLPAKEEFARAKSGFMSLIRGCTGYIGDISFAILINQSLDSKSANNKVKEIIYELANLNKKSVE
jgi:serine-type D-Ala-D-Ala carboxypeptidase/endopeptidase (penicillin-binding protein 4)